MRVNNSMIAEQWVGQALLLNQQSYQKGIGILEFSAP